jgi:superfamily I DNA/RNA helicase
MDWFVPFKDLTPAQRTVVGKTTAKVTGRHWIKGYAGSGKTIVLTHAAIQLLKKNRRAKVCYLTYTHALKDLTAMGLAEAGADDVEVRTVNDFFHSPEKYNHILVDEVQDVAPEKLKVIVAHAPHVIAAGDPAQSLYPKSPTPTQISGILKSPQVHILRDMPRLSLVTFQIGHHINPSAKAAKGAEVREEGSRAKVLKADSMTAEFTKVFQLAEAAAKPGAPAAVLFPKHNQIQDFAACVAKLKGAGEVPERKAMQQGNYEDFNDFFADARIPLRYFGNSSGDLAESEKRKTVFIMTYHSAKGLDFPHVFIPGLNSDSQLDARPKPLSKLSNERTLLFVAITRTKHYLTLSYHGEPHPLITDLPEECV